MTDELERAASGLSTRNSAVVQGRIRARCGGEIGGFYCENKVTIEGFDEWGLTPSFRPEFVPPMSQLP
jgi:hypothetical protein